MPLSLGEDYFNLVTRVMPLRDSLITSQQEMIAQLRDLSDDQETRYRIATRMNADLEAMLVTYRDEVAIRKDLERVLAREARRKRFWRTAALVAGAAATVLVLK